MDSGSLYTHLSGIVALMAASGFFSGSETALMATSRAKLHALEEQGKHAATRVSKMLDDPETLLATLLLGNNLVNIGASALATKIMLDIFGSAGLAIATFGMTFIVLIFAEVLPKTLAARSPERFAMIVSLPLTGLIKLSKPVTYFIRGITKCLIFILGLDNKDYDTNFGEDDVKGAIGLGAFHGVLEKSERQMLDGILDLDMLTVEDVMTHRSKIESIDVNSTVDNIYTQMANSSHSRLPVWEESPDNVIGILHIKDFYRLFKAHQNGEDNGNIRDIMQPPYFVPEQAVVSDQLLEFRRQRKHLGLVVDEYGDIMGLVTLEDILEEIVGEIEDEHDEVLTNFVRQKDGSIIVSGAFPVRDANREFDWHLPDEDAVTIGGLIVDNAERIPNLEESIEFNGYTFKILARRKQAVTRVKIIPPKQKSSSQDF